MNAYSTKTEARNLQLFAAVLSGTGLGSATRVDWLEIRWPAASSRVERFQNLSADRCITIVEGKGIS
jgi:hypothetical protein